MARSGRQIQLHGFRYHVVEVRFSRVTGLAPDETFRQGFEWARDGFSLITALRFFDRRDLFKIYVSSYAKILESHERALENLAHAQGRKAKQQRIRQLESVIPTYGMALTNKHMQIHAAVVDEFHRLVRSHEPLAVEVDTKIDQTYKRIVRFAEREELADLRSLIELAQGVSVDVFSPSFLLCKRENMTVNLTMG